MRSSSDLINKAREMTGLDDFGHDGFREGLERLVSAVEREARLNEAGSAMYDGQVINLLSQRLKVEQCYADNPAIADEEIVAPLIVLGLPRTGSTALHCLLAEDPSVRVIRNWEGMQPCPPPETETQFSDPRIAYAERQMEVRAERTPRMQQMLPSTATSPVECQMFMGYDFKSQMFQSMAYIPSYFEWLYDEADLEPTYAYVKRVMKLLQWRCPPRKWRLKNPSHSLFIGALDRTFPDAKYCMTHRNPAKVLASVADLYLELHRPCSDHVDKLALGTEVVDFSELGMRRMMDFRQSGQESRFFDIQFASFQADPYPILADLYRFVGEELTSEVRERMELWRQSTPKDKHGAHVYEGADFGITPEIVEMRFAFYNARFSSGASG